MAFQIEVNGTKTLMAFQVEVSGIVMKTPPIMCDAYTWYRDTSEIRFLCSQCIPGEIYGIIPSCVLNNQHSINSTTELAASPTASTTNMDQTSVIVKGAWTSLLSGGQTSDFLILKYLCSSLSSIPVSRSRWILKRINANSQNGYRSMIWHLSDIISDAFRISPRVCMKMRQPNRICLWSRSQKPQSDMLCCNRAFNQ